MGEVVSNPRRGGKNTAAVEQFNAHVPIGTPVAYWPSVRDGEGKESATRSAAWLLGGHTPVVMVEGYPGGIALTHVLPLSTVGRLSARDELDLHLIATQGRTLGEKPWADQ